MRKELHKPHSKDDRVLEAGIEWIVARQLAPVQDEILRLRATIEALREVVAPW
jgi:hypothetical protein